MNARITWKSASQDWETAFGATNLTDKFYYINKAFGAAPGNVTEGRPGSPPERVTIRVVPARVSAGPISPQRKPFGNDIMSTESVLKRISEERVALVQAALPKVAAVILGRRRVLSGIRWRNDLVITAAEAIGGAKHVDVRLEGDEVGAEVVANDLATDVAVVRVSAVAPDASTAVAPTGALQRVGEAIAAVGRTLRGPAAIWGSVQLAGPAWTSLHGGRIDQRVELDIGFHPELEGAAIIDLSGKVIAMAVPGVNHRVLGIPASTIESVVSRVDQFGRLPKPYLGIRLQTLWLDDDTRTRLGRGSRRIAAVGGVDAGSPAAQAHVELGDLVLTLDGEPAEGVNGLARRIAGTHPGQTVALEVLRGGKPLTITVQMGERPRH